MMTQTSIKFLFHSSIAGIRLVRGMNVIHSFPCHSHGSYAFGIVKKGRRIIQSQKEQHIVSANECFIIHPRQSHACVLEGETGHDYAVLSINPQLLRRIFRATTGEEGFPHFSMVKIAESSLTDKFSAWLDEQTESELTDGEGLADILTQLVLRHGDDRVIVQPRQKSHPVAALVSQYIETHLDRVVRLGEIADTARISPFYLNRIFRKEMGIPPYAYLLQTRINKSLALLLRTNSITEVAHHLGFSDQSHFTRLFKRNIGITPKRYLDLHRTRTP